MTDATAEAVNWALERAARIADEACECGVGKKLAAEIRALKVEHVHIDFATPEELDELNTLECFAAARGPAFEENVRAIEQAEEAIEQAAGIGSAPIETDAIGSSPVPSCAGAQNPAAHDRKGPLVPVNGAYRFTCSSCGYAHP